MRDGAWRGALMQSEALERTSLGDEHARSGRRAVRSGARPEGEMWGEMWGEVWVRWGGGGGGVVGVVGVAAVSPRRRGRRQIPRPRLPAVRHPSTRLAALAD